MAKIEVNNYSITIVIIGVRCKINATREQYFKSDFKGIKQRIGVSGFVCHRKRS